LQSHVSICTGCSAGCSIRIEENRGTVYRLKPRHNPAVNGWWICDEGRLSYKQAAAANRLRAPQRRGDGGLQEASWAEILPAASQALAEAVQRHGGAALVGVLSPQLACEEAWLLAKFLKSLSPEVKLALGPLSVVGQDEFFPQLPGGQTPPKPTFVIRAEKCPNRRGIEAILQGLEGGVRSFDDVLDEIRGGLIRGAVLTGGYPAPWLNEEQADVLARLEPSVLVDSFAWPFSPRVQYLLPGAVWAEKEGSYVNQAGRLQVTERAVRPAGGARAEGRIFWEWAHRPRLFSAADVRAELAAQLPFFAAAGGRVGEWGIPLAQPAG
jgi:NADH-quinone oxidoreductase subunit G